ncbi:MAG: hypothetical protein IJX25_00330 [Clostridia bacterium]|nr:hypothetical protein [Clostridia bacterium]
MKVFNQELTEELKEYDLKKGYLGFGQIEGKDVYVYFPFSKEQEIKQLRYRRENECFSIINRGTLWYNTLTEEQRLELDVWYKSWLDVTITKEIPRKPSWLK